MSAGSDGGDPLDVHGISASPRQPVPPDHGGSSFDVVPVAISEYQHHVAVPEIEQDVERIAELFAVLGGDTLTWSVTPASRDLTAVKSRLDGWASGDSQRSSVVVWLGHGEAIQGGAWLATVETGSPMSYSGFGPAQLVDPIVKQWLRRGVDSDAWTVVIIEACGAGTFARLMVNALPAHAFPDRLAILPIAGDGASYVGELRQALGAVLASYTFNDTVIDVADLFRRIALRLRINRLMAFGMDGLPPLQRRPVARDGVTLSVDLLATIRASLEEMREPVLDGDLHEPVSYFVGRREEKADLVRWLTQAEPGMVVVTGAGGSGKSALLGRLLLEINPAMRSLLPAAEGLAEFGDAGPVHLVIRMTGLTVDQVVQRLAVAAGLGDPEATYESGRNVDWLVQELAKREEMFTVVVDALDGAAEPIAIAGAVLRPLAANPRVQILVGTRAFANKAPDQDSAGTDLLDILRRDDRTRVLPVDFDATAIRAYVDHRLEHGSSGRIERYDRAEIADLIVATGRHFLFAQIIVTELLAKPELSDRNNRSALHDLLRSSNHELFDGVARRVAGTTPFAAALLEALALAEGKGLPRVGRIWSIAATALADPQVVAQYSKDELETVLESEIDALLDSAAPYIMLDAEMGRSVYRLAHQDFRDRYEQAASTAPRHALIVTALIDQASTDATVGQDSYVVCHLAQHVARARAWADLAAAPELLDYIDQDTIAAEVLRTSFGDPQLPPEISAIAAARHVLGAHLPEARRLIRCIAVTRYTTKTVAEGTAVAGKEWRWSQARLRHEPVSVVIAGHHGVVTASIAVKLGSGRLLLATGGSDRTVRLWDVSSGQPVGPPLRGHQGTVVALAAPASSTRCLLASCDTAGEVWIWEPLAGIELCRLPASEAGYCTVAAVTGPDGSPILVTGEVNGTVRSWTFEGKPLGSSKPSGAPVAALAPVIADGSRRLAIGGRDGSVRIVSAEADDAQDVIYSAHRGRVNGLGSAEGVLYTAGTEPWLACWDTEFGRPLGVARPGHTDSINAVTPISIPLIGTAVATASSDGSVRLWRAGADPAQATVLTGHHGPVRTVTDLSLHGRCTVIASGGDDGYVRLWAPKVDGHANDRDARRVALVSALAAVGDGRVVAGSPAGTVMLHGGHDTALAIESSASVDGAVVDVAAHVNGAGRLVIALAAGDSGGWVWTGGELPPRPLIGSSGRVTSLAMVQLRNRRLLLITGSDDRVRLWNPDTAASIGEMDLRAGRVSAVAAMVGPNGVPLIVSATVDREIRIWRPDSDVAPAVVHADMDISTISMIDLGSDGLRVVAGGHDGVARMWNPLTPHELGVPLPTHTRSVTGAVGLRAESGRRLIATGGVDGTINLWDPQAKEPAGSLYFGVPVRALADCGQRLVVGTDVGIIVVEWLPESGPEDV